MLRRCAPRRSLPSLVLVLLALALLGVAACDSEAPATLGVEPTGGSSAKSGDVMGAVGEVIEVGNARVLVNALQATFQPVVPGQRLSEQTPAAPGAGESFYQAYVRVENLGVEPVRVDATDFTCLVGTTVVSVELTRSGPTARSLLKNASLDLVLTFKAEAGFIPELRYNPPWYQGAIHVSPAQEGTFTTE